MLNEGHRLRALLLVGATTLAACHCQGGPPPPAAPPAVGGWYRAVLSKGQVAVPFFLLLPVDVGARRALLVNGAQKLAISNRWSGARVSVDFPLYRTRIRARAGSDGTLVGTWRSSSRAWGDAELAFRARPIAAPSPEARFPPVAGAGSAAFPALPAIWELSLSRSGHARLSLTRKGDIVTGLIQFSTGDYVYMAGNLRGAHLELSAFDGTSPYLFTATLAGGGRMHLRGTWLAGQALAWKERFSGHPNRHFTLPPPVRMESGALRVEVAELNSPRYQDKPVLLQLTGSWTPAYRAVAPLLIDLYRRDHPLGLEILTLDYEFTNDDEFNQAQAAEIKDRYDLPWTVTAIDGTITDYWDIIPGGLTGVAAQGFPIAIFLRRDGTVARTVSGFVGSEAPRAHAALARAYTRAADDILGGVLAPGGAAPSAQPEQLKRALQK